MVIIDGFSSGSALMERPPSRGFKVIHIQSSNQISPIIMTTKGATGDEEWMYDGNIEELVARLRAVKPNTIMASADLGVPLSDPLNGRLGMRGNPLKSSPARQVRDDRSGLQQGLSNMTSTKPGAIQL